MGKPGKLLTAGQLLSLADRVRDLHQEVIAAGFSSLGGLDSFPFAVAWLEGEAGARCVRELREQSHGREAA